MDFSKEIIKEKEFYKKNFSVIGELLLRIRKSLTQGELLITSDLDLNNVIKYNKDFTYIFITLFQGGLKPIRWGSCKNNLNESLNRDIEKIKENKKFSDFDINNPLKCRIMLEYITDRSQPFSLDEIQVDKFASNRFEPGITGISILLDGALYSYTPTDAWVNSHLGLKSVLNFILRKTPIKNMTNKISKRIKILKSSDYRLYLTKSRAFITYENEFFALYRGNVLNTFSIPKLKDIALNGSDWIVKYQKPDGRYLYYYDACEDNYKDHEHPKRSKDNLYYNDLRHSGGIVTLLYAYQLTKDEKYLVAAKKGVDFITTITKDYITQDGQNAAYAYYNKKAKLGGTGMILIAMMKYRIATKDKTYDEYIKKYVLHLISRISKTGEMLGYYIHPDYHNGEPLEDLSDKERQNTFSFYYPGEALLGLALFANRFDGADELKSMVLEKSKIALDWIVDERPKIYKDLFTSLPSDAWLMQAIEEWAYNPDFQKENYINFVLNDANTMIEKTYTEDDSPYLDYNGSYYYNYGDHFYPDGSRSEGLVAAYYLAKNLNKLEIAEKILSACKKTALSQMVLYNDARNNYAHKNPEKSSGAIRFKATRQWIRVDSIQHVACFYFRLYNALS